MKLFQHAAIISEATLRVSEATLPKTPQRSHLHLTHTVLFGAREWMGLRGG
jgi:hypothetical protein